MTSYLRACRQLPLAQRLLLFKLAGAVALANVAQPYPEVAPLQHIPTVILILAAPILLWWFPLSNRSVMYLVNFFLLHTLAARYTYSNVPYDDWARILTGHDISSLFNLKRNGFDRVVHLSFGLFWIQPISEALRRHAAFSLRASVWTAFLFVGAVSAAYEIFEWLLTIVVDPTIADDYNGEQGDVWDSQKDMATAIVGAFIASIWSLRTWRKSA